MTANELSIRRAWSGTCPDGHLRDYFANSVAHRINEESHDSAMAGYSPELVEDFVDRCDRLFAEHSPDTYERVAALATEIDTLDLYELTGE